MAATLGAASCPMLSAAAVPTLLNLGEVAMARRLTHWLRSIQRRDGSFPTADAGQHSLVNTAQAISTLLTWDEPHLADSLLAAERAAGWLASRIDAAGRFDLSGIAPSSIDQWAAPAVYVACLPALQRASQRFGVPVWRQAVVRARDHLQRTVACNCFNQAAQIHALAVDAWLALGEVELARDAMRWPAAAQLGNGAVPTEPGGRWICSAAVARFALAWYKLADRSRADRALASLRSRQLPSGGFPDGWAHGVRRCSYRESAWTTVHFLDASLAQVQTSFEYGVAGLPDRIDPADGRFRAVHQWFESLGRAAKIADVGCGSGRFVRELARQFPAAKIVAIDPSQRALDACIGAAERRLGSLLRIPAGAGEFDGALAVESLEHSLLPERAVRELCRVVRPGGRILIIDKHLAKQRLSEHEPWEQWFLPETVSSWLARECHSVTAWPIAHGRAVEPGGLFWCWQATR